MLSHNISSFAHFQIRWSLLVVRVLFIYISLLSHKRFSINFSHSLFLKFLMVVLSTKYIFANTFFFFPCRFETKIDSFHVTGLPDNSTKPRLLSSLDNTASLFQITFETNPLDETVAQRCIIEAEPLEIIYDAVSIF